MKLVRARSVETFGRGPRATHCRIKMTNRIGIGFLAITLRVTIVAFNDQYIQHWFFSDNSSYFARKMSFKFVVHKGVFYSMKRVRARSVEAFGRDPRATHCRVKWPTNSTVVF